MKTIVLTTAVILLLDLLSFVGCATTKSEMAAKVLQADERMITNCKYLGDVTGTSGWGNLAASTGVNNAKNEALEQAASLGATHVVWTQVSAGYVSFVNGRAYRCE